MLAPVTSSVWPQVPCTILQLHWSSVVLWWSVGQMYEWPAVQGRCYRNGWEQHWCPPSSVLSPHLASLSAEPLKGTKNNNFSTLDVCLLNLEGFLIWGGLFSILSLPASCSWIFSISIGVVMMTWHIPAQHPANISLKTVSPPLKRHADWVKANELGLDTS